GSTGTKTLITGVGVAGGSIGTKTLTTCVGIAGGATGTGTKTLTTLSTGTGTKTFFSTGTRTLTTFTTCTTWTTLTTRTTGTCTTCTTGAGSMHACCCCDWSQVNQATEHVPQPSPSCCRDESGAARPSVGAAWAACTADGRRNGAPPPRTVRRQPNRRTRASLWRHIADTLLAPRSRPRSTHSQGSCV